MYPAEGKNGRDSLNRYDIQVVLLVQYLYKKKGRHFCRPVLPVQMREGFPHGFKPPLPFCWQLWLQQGF